MSAEQAFSMALDEQERLRLLVKELSAECDRAAWALGGRTASPLVAGCLLDCADRARAAL